MSRAICPASNTIAAQSLLKRLAGADDACAWSQLSARRATWRRPGPKSPSHAWSGPIDAAVARRSGFSRPQARRRSGVPRRARQPRTTIGTGCHRLAVRTPSVRPPVSFRGGADSSDRSARCRWRSRLARARTIHQPPAPPTWHAAKGAALPTPSACSPRLGRHDPRLRAADGAGHGSGRLLELRPNPSQVVGEVSAWVRPHQGTWHPA